MDNETRKHRADHKIAAIVSELQQETGLPQLRTHVDEWAAFKFGGYLLTGGGRQRWFNNPCPCEHGRKLADCMPWVSPEADEILHRGARGDPGVMKPPAGEPAPFRLVVDHSVPIGELRRLLEANPDLWTCHRVAEFLDHHYQRGVLTKLEHDGLGAAGLSQHMPPDWRLGSDPFARYHHVGIAQALG